MSADAALSALLGLRAKALSENIEVLVATVPPVVNRGSGVNRRMAWTNALLRFYVPADWLMDFDSDITPDDFFPDGIHFNTLGQNERATAAGRALSRLAGD